MDSNNAGDNAPKMKCPDITPQNYKWLINKRTRYIHVLLYLLDRTHAAIGQFIGLYNISTVRPAKSKTLFFAHSISR